MNPVEVVKNVQKEFPSVDQVQQAITYLKENGYDRADSMVVLQRAYGISPNESKMMIHHSLAWSADRAVVEKLHEQMDRDLDSSS
jgi:hypothetical protein